MQPQPRTPRRRRWVGLVVLLLVLGLLALALVPPGVGLASDAGVEDVRFRFRVTEAETGRPLPGAFIRLFSREKVARDLITGRSGEGEMTAPCPVTVRRTLFSRRRSVAVPDWCFFVSSLGHKMAGPFYVRDYVGPHRDAEELSALPVIEVRMEKQDELPAGN